MLEIITDWSAINTRPGVSVMYADADIDAAAPVRTALNAFYTSLRPMLAPATRFTIRTTGRILDPLDGSLQGDWIDTPTYTNTGSATGIPVANAAQMLLRLNTGVIREGRRLKGRTFVPGAASVATQDGVLSAPNVIIANNAGATLVAAATGLGVWSRPREGGASGAIFPLSSVTVWNEFAVLRRRR